MKTLLFVCAIILLSCEKEPLPLYCWQCDSVLYGKHIQDIVCDKSALGINDYQTRLINFYQGGMTSIDCQLMPE